MHTYGARTNSRLFYFFWK
jgi:hypothetical protein